MKSRIVIGFSLACLFFAMVICLETARAQGDSPHHPIPVGVPVVTMIECGEGYTSLELYDARITLLEIVRGKKAWERIKEASPSNTPPDAGFEYILARIKFGLSKRGLPGDKNYDLKGVQFSAFSIDGREYKILLSVQPKPELSGRLRSGDSLEGWLAFLVAKEDGKPLMNFNREHDGGIWFQLY